MNPYVIALIISVCLTALFACVFFRRRKTVFDHPTEESPPHVDDIQFSRMLLRLSGEAGDEFHPYSIARTDQSGGVALSVFHSSHGELFRAFWTAESLAGDSFPLQISALKNASPKAVREMRDFFVVTYHRRLV